MEMNIEIMELLKAMFIEMNEEMLAKMGVNHKKMMTEMRAWREERKADQETREATDSEANPEEKQCEAEQGKIPKEEAAVKSSGTMKKRHRGRHLAAGRRGEPKETDPRRLRIPEEVGCRLQEGVPPCKSGMTQEEHRQE
jgi:hypothetical protein